MKKFETKAEILSQKYSTMDAREKEQPDQEFYQTYDENENKDLVDKEPQE